MPIIKLPNSSKIPNDILNRKIGNFEPTFNELTAIINRIQRYTYSDTYYLRYYRDI